MTDVRVSEMGDGSIRGRKWVCSKCGRSRKLSSELDPTDFCFQPRWGNKGHIYI